ncbi:MAG: hypothetical protein HQL58_04330 [Magnetococcales bacterium]|nr:hypothetical protein [Magnetococcales bacterium]
MSDLLHSVSAFQVTLFLLSIGVLAWFGTQLARLFHQGDAAATFQTRTEQLVYHASPWQPSAQGESLGLFRNQIIPAWIRLPDGRQADYAGIFGTSLPEECYGIEFPQRGEVVIRPGIVYTLRMTQTSA